MYAGRAQRGGDGCQALPGQGYSLAKAMGAHALSSALPRPPTSLPQGPQGPMFTGMESGSASSSSDGEGSGNPTGTAWPPLLCLFMPLHPVGGGARGALSPWEDGGGADWPAMPLLHPSRPFSVLRWAGLRVAMTQVFPPCQPWAGCLLPRPVTQCLVPAHHIPHGARLWEQVGNSPASRSGLCRPRPLPLA